MKNLTYAFIALISLSLISCEQDVMTFTTDFEDVELVAGKLHNKSFNSRDLEFENSYNAEYDSWEGFAASSLTDITTTGFENQYSVIAGKAFSGSNFGVVYKGMKVPKISVKDKDADFLSMRICNSTYAYLSMKDGDSYTKKFGKDDWFKVTITGLSADSTVTGSVDFYLADFRNGKTEIIKEWTNVDLRPLGKCRKIAFEFASTDNGDYGMNTPAYAMIDDIIYQFKEN